MSKHSWKDIREAMKEQAAPAPSQERDEFWRQFRARATTQPREDEVEAPAGWLGWGLLRYGAAVATIAIVAVWLALYTGRGPQGPTLSAGRPNQVRSLEVAAEHSAVFVMQSDDQSSTIVWIADMRETTAP